MTAGIFFPSPGTPRSPSARRSSQALHILTTTECLGGHDVEQPTVGPKGEEAGAIESKSANKHE